jgi:trehalose synthase
VLAGPDPHGVEDDPEAAEVFREICAVSRGLDEGVRRDVAVLRLPMHSTKENALMVNALQRCSSVVM